jgi:hypothetical protein
MRLYENGAGLRTKHVLIHTIVQELVLVQVHRLVHVLELLFVHVLATRLLQ